MELGPQEVHVWTASIDPDAPHWMRRAIELPDPDRTAADQLASRRGRARFVRERILLRECLARYLGVSPARVQLTRDRRGKPHLSEMHQAGIEFSLSDSGEQVWIAVGQCGPLGLDIERTRGGLRIDDLTRRFLAEREVEALLSLPQEQRQAAFFRTWVRKEAYLKALGGGVPERLSRFAVSVAPDDRAAVVATQLEDDGVSSFSLYDLESPPGYVASLAAGGTRHRIRILTHGGRPPASRGGAT